MKSILFLFLLSVSSCIKTLYLPKNGTIEFGSTDTEGKFYAVLSEFKDNSTVSFRIETDGSFNKKIRYAFTKNNPQTSTDSLSKEVDYYNDKKENGVLSLDYTIVKEDSSYLIMEYRQFSGNYLKIKVIDGDWLLRYLAIILIVFGLCCCASCIGGCIACYCCCCKDSNKSNYPGEIIPQNENNAQNSGSIPQNGEYIPPNSA